MNEHQRNRPHIAQRPVLAAVLLGLFTAGPIYADELSLDDIPFNGRQAYEYLKQICDLGPRPSGSLGMTEQQKFLTKHFTELGGAVREQRFRTQHPLNGSAVTMANLIVEWHPEKAKRVLICAHYDTRPLPDEDPDPRKRRSGRFVGANDGASGVAVLMELARAMPKLESNYGVDFVMFDGEEFIFGSSSRRQEKGKYFLGSEWFARQYVKNPPKHAYRWGVLLDMIGDADLQIYQERNSVRWRDTRPLVKEIWATAARLGVRDFVPRTKYAIGDDHLPLRNIGKIPTCDIIDFDYPVFPRNHYWHTEADTPQRCSALSLAKVGWVLHEWLKIAGSGQ